MSKVYFLLAAMLFCFSSSVKAEHLLTVHPKEITLTEKGMFLQRNGEVYLVKRLEEADGYYLATISEKTIISTWPCRNCGARNSHWKNYCAVCGFCPNTGKFIKK